MQALEPQLQVVPVQPRIEVRCHQEALPCARSKPTRSPGWKWVVEEGASGLHREDEPQWKGDLGGTRQEARRHGERVAHPDDRRLEGSARRWPIMEAQAT